MLLAMSPIEVLIVALLFLWAGFVRSGFGFGGAALGLPLMLFIDPDPLTWLPVIGTHLLFFSTLTLRTRLDNIDWDYLKRSSLFIVPAALMGVIGLISLPTRWLLVFIYSISLFYACIWMLNRTIKSHSALVDKILLSFGGYIAGTSLTGAPLMVAVYMRNVSREQLRNTLFVLWFTLVSIKMSAFAALGINLHFITALALIPVAAIGRTMLFCKMTRLSNAGLAVV
jgi:uncharacterized membrane protein YfcA